VTAVQRAEIELEEVAVAPARDEDDSLVGDSMSGSLWTGVSRITGFVRATAIAGILGATYLGNTFQALNSLPNLVYYQLLAGSLFASVLVPVLVRHLKHGDERRTHEILCGFFGTMLTLAAAAGVLQTSRAGSGDPTIPNSFLFPALTAVFLGATMIRPGKYNVWGTVIGVFLVAVSVSGLTLLGATGWVQQVFDGAALIFAVALSTFMGRARERRATAGQSRADLRAPAGELPAEPRTASSV
jgi:peptidoglycan biosynthesis protein MviN/MurJ (putative lipid II flippase)